MQSLGCGEMKGVLNGSDQMCSNYCQTYCKRIGNTTFFKEINFFHRE
jgi:hypothetical protein